MELSKLKKFILEKRKEGKLVFSTLEGYASMDVAKFIKQPIDGILYDLNRLEETALTFIDKPEYGIKWVNDFAVALTIRELKSSLAEAREERDAFILMYQMSVRPVDVPHEEVVKTHRIVNDYLKKQADEKS